MTTVNVTVGGLIANALRDAWAVIQPVDCAGCGLADRAICAECLVSLAFTPRERQVPRIPMPVVAAGDYGGVLRELLLAGKDGGRGDALRALAPLLRQAIARAMETIPTGTTSLELTWVPSSPGALRRRGFDPVLNMLRRCRLSPSRVLAARDVLAQKSLDRDHRLVAATSRFRARSNLAGRGFLLVDDVLTTGATISAAALAIERAGGLVLGASCLGTVPLRGAVDDSAHRAR